MDRSLYRHLDRRCSLASSHPSLKVGISISVEEFLPELTSKSELHAMRLRTVSDSLINIELLSHMPKKRKEKNVMHFVYGKNHPLIRIPSPPPKEQACPPNPLLHIQQTVQCQPKHQNPPSSINVSISKSVPSKRHFQNAHQRYMLRKLTHRLRHVLILEHFCFFVIFLALALPVNVIFKFFSATLDLG